jgi:hypothetical protein
MNIGAGCWILDIRFSLSIDFAAKFQRNLFSGPDGYRDWNLEFSPDGYRDYFLFSGFCKLGLEISFRGSFENEVANQTSFRGSLVNEVANQTSFRGSLLNEVAYQTSFRGSFVNEVANQNSFRGSLVNEVANQTSFMGSFVNEVVNEYGIRVSFAFYMLNRLLLNGKIKINLLLIIKRTINQLKNFEMKQILELNLGRLRNDEHFQFMSEVDKLIEKTTTEALGISLVYNQFSSELKSEETALRVEYGSSQTKLIADADLRRDQLIRAFEMQVESLAYHWDPNVVEAARRIGRIVNQYGNLRTKNYNEESSGITHLVQEISTGTYKNDLAIMSLTDWTTQLTKVNDHFMNLFNNRADELATRASGDVSAARKLIDITYKTIVSRINALVIVNGEENFTEFIDRLNYFINYNRNTIAARKGRKEVDAEPEPTN